MKFFTKKVAALLVACMMLASAMAMAETISFEGTVTASKTYEVYAAIGGTVESVEAEVGQRVSAGDVIATLTTTKVYAPESGTITGLFGEAGDSAENVAEKYGAVMYIEGESVYTIEASTDNAYNSTTTKFVHVGEEVYLKCYSDGDHTGTGVITSITGTDYTVQVKDGEFLIGETVNVYRGSSATSSMRIGRGELTRANPTAVSGSGSIVSFAVSNGDSVQRGDLLFETLEGEFDGLYMSGNQILAEEDGTIAEINLSQGSKIEKGSIAAVLYPNESMQIEAKVEETNLASLNVGESVLIELIWNQDSEVSYPGTISMISAIANSAGEAMEESETVTYNVYVDFAPDASTRYGMSAVVTTLEDGENYTANVIEDEVEEDGSEQE